MTHDIRAVLFDFGGVILSSPIEGFHAYERSAGLPPRFLQTLNTIDPDTNAWACAERGEIDEDTFYARFEAEARARGHTIDARAVTRTLTGTIRAEMVDAVRALRPRYRTACLTNNMRLGQGTAMSPTPTLAADIAEAMAVFDHVIESRVLGTRKPEVAFFERACEIIGVAPAHCVFLDDLGVNLKTARALGMVTIKVADPAVALAELAAVLAAATP
jgi:putative hydrolase of the HAD superfamily